MIKRGFAKNSVGYRVELAPGKEQERMAWQGGELEEHVEQLLLLWHIP